MFLYIIFYYLIYSVGRFFSDYKKGFMKRLLNLIWLEGIRAGTCAATSRDTEQPHSGSSAYDTPGAHT